MAARAQPTESSSHPARDRAASRLPWWAVTLPALSFCALLALLLASSEAHAADGGTGPLARLLTSVLRSLPLW